MLKCFNRINTTVGAIQGFRTFGASTTARPFGPVRHEANKYMYKEHAVFVYVYCIFNYATGRKLAEEWLVDAQTNIKLKLTYEAKSKWFKEL